MKRILMLALVVPALGGGTYAMKESFWASLGNRTGPTQPIAFSHQIHADTLGMNCLYCHYSAEKSPVANLPPVSTCMGCHIVVRADKPEIKKLWRYYAMGGPTAKPIPWVRIHKVPEYVHFPHVRHVNAGVTCQTCHGQIQKMDQVLLAERRSPERVQMGVHMDDAQNPTTMDCVVCHH